MTKRELEQMVADLQNKLSVLTDDDNKDIVITEKVIYHTVKSGIDTIVFNQDTIGNKPDCTYATTICKYHKSEWIGDIKNMSGLMSYRVSPLCLKDLQEKGYTIIDNDNKITSLVNSAQNAEKPAKKEKVSIADLI